MNDIVKIDTKRYAKIDPKVDIDGNIWSIHMPGAGKSMEYTKLQRLAKVLYRKVESNTHTEDDAKRLDEIEDWTIEFFLGVFRDDTPDNADVRKWLEETPAPFIMQAFEDVQEQAKKNNPINEP